SRLTQCAAAGGKDGDFIFALEYAKDVQYLTKIKEQEQAGRDDESPLPQSNGRIREAHYRLSEKACGNCSAMSEVSVVHNGRSRLAIQSRAEHQSSARVAEKPCARIEWFRRASHFGASSTASEKN